MVLSMTGFGRGEVDYRGGKVIVEILTVNSRYLDISVHGLRDQGAVEMALREATAEHINRGRINITVKCTGIICGERTVTVDEDLVKKFGEELDRAKWLLGIEEKVSVDVLAARPELVEIVEHTGDDGFVDTVLTAAAEAFEQVVTSRRTEGVKLAADLEKRFKSAGEIIARVETRAPEMLSGYHGRLKARAKALGADGISGERIDAEVVLFAERSDITEEITRFRTHLDAALDALGKDGRIGRRLEFLVQELNRETNTMGAKSQDAGISSAVVEIKETLEQIREQVQNIE
ncbi:MAG: YicC family protein [Candidatus Coatesbacteria bacterium]|nr:MAG: YicC family protein [Candidatus Coatesbacteria bacterium]